MPAAETHNHKAFQWVTDYLEKKEVVYMTGKQFKIEVQTFLFGLFSLCSFQQFRL